MTERVKDKIHIQGGRKPGKTGILGNSLNLENSWNSKGILCNLRENYNK